MPSTCYTIRYLTDEIERTDSLGRTTLRHDVLAQAHVIAPSATMARALLNSHKTFGAREADIITERLIALLVSVKQERDCDTKLYDVQYTWGRCDTPRSDYVLSPNVELAMIAHSERWPHLLNRRVHYVLTPDYSCSVTI